MSISYTVRVVTCLYFSDRTVPRKLALYLITQHGNIYKAARDHDHFLLKAFKRRFALYFSHSRGIQKNVNCMEWVNEQ